MSTLGICGSLSKRSANHRLLQALQQAWSMQVHSLDALPMFNPDIEIDGAAPRAVLAWRNALQACSGVVFACPEYGHNLPGVLKNALDWVIQSGELGGKPVYITAAVSIAEQGALARASLRQTLEVIECQVRFDAGAVDGDLSALLAALGREAQ